MMPAAHRGKLMAGWETSQNVGGLAAGCVGMAPSVSLAFAIPAALLLALCGIVALVAAAAGIDNADTMSNGSAAINNGNGGGGGGGGGGCGGGGGGNLRGEDGSVHGNETVVVDGDSEAGPGVLELIWQPGILAACAAYSCVRSTRYLLIFWLPYHFAAQHGVDPGTAGALAACYE